MAAFFFALCYIGQGALSEEDETNAMNSFAGEKLECVRGERIVFSALDFTVEGGGALLLTGPNGSGKSSLLRLMASLIKPAAGHLSWNGGNISDQPEAHRARLHYIGHLDGIQPLLTVAENLRFWAGLRSGDSPGNPKHSAADAATEALEGFGLKALANLPCRFLSAGQCRRLALARLLVVPSALWLLDEPTTALDDDGVRAFHDAVARHRAQGGVVVLASHGTETIEGARTLDLRAHAGVPRDIAAQGLYS